MAYHALSGALHCAVSLKNTKYLKEVERLAARQLNWIDNHDPEYEHSTQSASKRGRPSIYRNLAKMANARAEIVQTKAKKDDPDLYALRSTIVLAMTQKSEARRGQSVLFLGHLLGEITSFSL